MELRALLEGGLKRAIAESGKDGAYREVRYLSRQFERRMFDVGHFCNIEEDNG